MLKIINGTRILLMLGFISINGCEQVSTYKEPKIIANCMGLLCSVSIESATIQTQTNILGNKIERVIKLSQYPSSMYHIKWSLDHGILSNNNELSIYGLPNCNNSECSLNSNPTAVLFDIDGVNNVGVEGSINGKDINMNANIKVPGYPSSVKYKLEGATNQKIKDSISGINLDSANIQSVQSSNGNVIFICKNGTFISPTVIDLPSGKSTEDTEIITKDGVEYPNASLVIESTQGEVTAKIDNYNYKATNNKFYSWTNTHMTGVGCISYSQSNHS